MEQDHASCAHRQTDLAVLLFIRHLRVGILQLREEAETARQVAEKRPLQLTHCSESGGIAIACSRETRHFSKQRGQPVGQSMSLAD